jgi:hypothetical protein
MNITVEIPDAIAGAVAGEGRDPARALLEAFALEGYRRRTLGESAIRRLLGFETRMEVHAFLNENGVPWPSLSIEDIERDTAVALEVALRARAERNDQPSL